MNNNLDNLKILIDIYHNPWSSSKVEDELVLHLSSYAETDIKEENNSNVNSNSNNYNTSKEIVIVKHPYQEQAKGILYKINLANRPLVFNIYSKLYLRN